MRTEQVIFEMIGRIWLYVAGYVAALYVLEIPVHLPTFKWAMFLLLYLPLTLPMVFPNYFNQE